MATPHWRRSPWRYWQDPNRSGDRGQTVLVLVRRGGDDPGLQLDAVAHRDVVAAGAGIDAALLGDITIVTLDRALVEAAANEFVPICRVMRFL